MDELASDLTIAPMDEVKNAAILLLEPENRDRLRKKYPELYDRLINLLAGEWKVLNSNWHSKE